MHGPTPEPVFVDLLRSSGIDSQPGGPVQQPHLSYRPAMLHRFLGFINVRLQIRALACQDTYAGGVEFLESIPGLHNRLQIWAQLT